MAKIYLDSGDNFTLSSTASVFGSTGTEKVVVNSGVTGVDINANVERVDLAGASSAYTYLQTGNALKVYSGTTLVATVYPQDDTDGTQLVFSNGSVSVKVAATGMTLGGATVPSTTAAAVTPTTIDATVTSGSGTSTGTTTGQTFSLTTGVDSGTAFTGGSGNDTFNSAPFISTAGTSVATFGALDALDGGAGEDTLNISSTAAFDNTTGSVASSTVKNIETANINSSGTVTADVTTWTGLTKLTAGQYGGGTVTGAATTDITLTDSAAAATTTSVQGGKNVNVTLNGVTTGALNVGGTTAVTGTLDVTTNHLATDSASDPSAITVKGGTTVNITANLIGKANSGDTVDGGTIGVTGTSATTTVTVKQSTTTAFSAETTAATGVLAKTAVTAAPGQNGVTAVTAVPPATAKAAVAGVANGAVTVTDSATTTGLGTIKTVTLENYGAGSTISSNALTDLTLKGTAGTLALTRDPSLGASDTLNLTLSSLSGTNTITDTKNEIKTLNVKATGGNSTLAAFTDANLKTLNISGDKLLSLTNVNTSLTKLAVSESASFIGDVSAPALAALDFTTTSSGSITATLDAATQKFTGSTGVTNITISADAKVAIAGGSGSNDKLVLNSNITTFNTALNVADNKGLTKLVSGFEVLGTGTASQGVYDVTLLPGGLKAVSMDGGAAAAISFTKLVDNTSLAINTAQANAVTYQLANASGVANTASLTLGNAANTTGFIVADLTLKDANDVGVGTLNVTSNASTWTAGHTISKLTDNGLSTLNVSGNASLTITDLTQSTTQATAFTVNNTLTGADDAVTITTLNDANLGALTFTGSGATTIGTLGALTGKVLTVSNTGTGTASIGAIGTTGVAGTKEIQTVALNDGLDVGESIMVNNVTVTNTGASVTSTGTLTQISATNVAIALSGGAVATGLSVTGLNNAAWTPTVTANNTVTYTATAVGDQGALGPIKGVVAVATAVGAGTKNDGVNGVSAEDTQWTMSALLKGQSVTLSGLTLTALKDLTGSEVAAGFAAITAVGDNTLAGSYAESGTLTTPAGWTTPTWSNPAGATLKITDGAQSAIGDFTTAPTTSPASTITDPTVSESLKGTGSAAAQALTTITMNGNVAWGSNGTTGSITAEPAIGATTGITVDGATNNAHVNITLNAAAAGSTNTIKLGNANNYITDLTTAGTVKINVGSGGNLIDIDQGANNTTYAAEVTLGAHTNTSTVFNQILVSDTGGQATGYSTVITGVAKGDVIVFNNGADLSFVTTTAAQQAAITAAANLSGAISSAFANVATGAIDKAAAFTYGGDTYIVVNAANDTTFNAGTDSIVKLTGIVTVADNGTLAGQVIIA